MIVGIAHQVIRESVNDLTFSKIFMEASVFIGSGMSGSFKVIHFVYPLGDSEAYLAATRSVPYKSVLKNFVKFTGKHL